LKKTGKKKGSRDAFTRGHFSPSKDRKQAARKKMKNPGKNTRRKRLFFKRNRPNKVKNTEKGEIDKGNCRTNLLGNACFFQKKRRRSTGGEGKGPEKKE